MDSIENNNGFIQVAFATTNLEDIDSHFGSAKRFYVFDVTKEQYCAVKIIEIKEKDTDLTVSHLKVLILFILWILDQLLQLNLSIVAFSLSNTKRLSKLKMSWGNLQKC